VGHGLSNLLGIKNLPECSSQRWALVLSGLAQKFKSLLRGGGCGYHVIQKTKSLGLQTHLIANTCQDAVAGGGS
jgi:hypothetical protein